MPVQTNSLSLLADRIRARFWRRRAPGTKVILRASRISVPIEFLEARQLLAAQIYITNASTGSAQAGVGLYSASGAAVNANLIKLGANDTYPFGIAVSGSDVFVSNYFAGTVGEYTTSGKTINAKLISGFPSGTGPFGLAISGSELFVAQGNGGAAIANGAIGEYTLGSKPGTIKSKNPKLVSGIDDAGSVAVSGSDLFVTDYALGTIDEFTTTGGTVANPLIAGLALPEDVAVSGGNLFVTESSGECVGEFTTSGTTVSQFLISGLSGPYGIAASSTDLFVNANGVIAEYTTQGTLVNPNFITGLSSPQGVLYVPGATTPSLSFTSEPTTAIVGSKLSPAVAVQILDGNGNPLASSATIKLSIATGPTGGKLGGTVSVKAVNGLATFSNLTVGQPGTYVLKATEGTITATSATGITATAVGATKLVLASQPTTVAAGKIQTAITFDTDSADGTIVTTNKSTVTLSIASGPTGAKLGGTVTAKVSKGVATFSKLQITLAGTYTFKASDPGLTSAFTGDILVTAAAPAKLVIASQPTTATAGSIVPAPVVLDVEDTYGNLAITDSSLVNMASSPSGKLSGFQIADSIGGIANFDDFDFTTAGSFSLKFTDGKLKSATSKKITVVFPPPTQLVFAAQPMTVVAGKKLSKVKVNVESASGIIVATDASTVALSIASGPAGAILGGTLTAKDVKGIASFSNLILKTAGTYTLEATDGSLISAISAPITVG